MADECSPHPYNQEIHQHFPNQIIDHCIIGNEEIPSKSEKIEDVRNNNEQSLRISNFPEIIAQNKGLQRYFIAVEYIGTRFSGSQKQLNGRTVAGVVEDAFHKFIGQPVSLFCSSRTDTGVHALSNVFHVDIVRISRRKPGEVLAPHEPSVIRKAANHFLQKEGDLTVIDVRPVPPDFHARFEARERTYYYRLLCGPEPLSVFDKDRAWHVRKELDTVSMEKACMVLTGCHDFSSFRGSGCQAKSPIRTVDELSVAEVSPWLSTFPSVDDDRENGITAKPHTSAAARGFGGRGVHRCYVITARARSFLYHQVRMMVGILKCVGAGDMSVGDVDTEGEDGRGDKSPHGSSLWPVPWKC